MGKKNIYFMGIGGTAMAALACFLKKQGHNVSGSDNALYSPTKELLEKNQINVLSPFKDSNLGGDIHEVVVGNVIRKINPENEKMLKMGFKHHSLPAYIYENLLKNRLRVVVSGTHGKTTCTSLLASILFHLGKSPGYFIGGVSLDLPHSCFDGDKKAPFIIEGDEYDTAYFDKEPKFLHYKPNILLVTSIEYDHADIYQNVQEIVKAFAKLFSQMSSKDIIIASSKYPHIKEALQISNTKAKVYFYGQKGDDYFCQNPKYSTQGVTTEILLKDANIKEKISTPLFGQHNLDNFTGVYACLKHLGLSHEEIMTGVIKFQGVKRRLQEFKRTNQQIFVEDFAHHPRAVYETILAAKQKYPNHKILAIFEPKSATSCLKLFEKDYTEAFLAADRVILAPLGRSLDAPKALNTQNIAKNLQQKGVPAEAFHCYSELEKYIKNITEPYVFLFMSNGSFNGMLKKL